MALAFNLFTNSIIRVDSGVVKRIKIKTGDDKMKKNHIEKVWIERQLDEQPDTSFIGEYTDKADDWNICRHCGEYLTIAEAPNKRAAEIKNLLADMEDDTLDSDETFYFESGNYGYYYPLSLKGEILGLNKELAALNLHECPNSKREYNFFKPYASGEVEGTENYQKYGKQDFERMEGLNNQNWYFMGIIAKAEIRTETGTMQVIRSGGLWGIESDSGNYLDEVGKEELENLRLELSALGFGKRAIDKAFQDVKTIDK
jgi:hypothetical protein